jgi:NADP-dependent 3-hydroxy acid dehydrogenase YdfG
LRLAARAALGWRWAVLLSEVGCKVMLADMAKAALATFSGSGREIRGIVCDVADPASVDTAAKATFFRLRQSAHPMQQRGVTARGGIDHIALGNWRWVLDVNRAA